MATFIRNTGLAALALTFLFSATAMAVPGDSIVSLMAAVNDEEAEYWGIDETGNNHSTNQPEPPVKGDQRPEEELSSE